MTLHVTRRYCFPCFLSLPCSGSFVPYSCFFPLFFQSLTSVSVFWLPWIHLVDDEHGCVPPRSVNVRQPIRSIHPFTSDKLSRDGGNQPVQCVCVYVCVVISSVLDTSVHPSVHVGASARVILKEGQHRSFLPFFYIRFSIPPSFCGASKKRNPIHSIQGIFQPSAIDHRLDISQDETDGELHGSKLCQILPLFLLQVYELDQPRSEFMA